MRRRRAAGISSGGVAEFYYDSYDIGYVFDTNPENMVDGDENTYATAHLSNTSQNQLLDSIVGDLKSGTITKVEMRVKCYYSNRTATTLFFYLEAYLSGSSFSVEVPEITDTSAWSAWLDVSLTAEIGEGVISSWEDISNLGAIINTSAAGAVGFRDADVHVSKVEMRVTYT